MLDLADVVLCPVLKSVSGSMFGFKVECGDPVLLIDIKQEVERLLVGKEFRVEFRKGWYEG